MERRKKRGSVAGNGHPVPDAPNGAMRALWHDAKGPLLFVPALLLAGLLTAALLASVVGVGAGPCAAVVVPRQTRQDGPGRPIFRRDTKDTGPGRGRQPWLPDSSHTMPLTASPFAVAVAVRRPPRRRETDPPSPPTPPGGRM